MTEVRDPDPQRVWVFFYGTFMSARVLSKYGIECESTVPALLLGYKLTINLRANLEDDPSSIAYGGLANIKQTEVASLYKGLVDGFSLIYEPRSVVAATLDGKDMKALCYLCEDMKPGLADPAYLDEMVRCCKELGLPDSYSEHIMSFAP